MLWAGAQDERVAAVFSVVPGEMGASLIRRDWGETLDDMAQNFPWQFAGNLQKWVGKWNDLPVDQHLLIALCAPRPVYVNGGLTDQWSDPKGEFLALVAAGPVYRLLGAKDLGVTELAAAGPAAHQRRSGFSLSLQRPHRRPRRLEGLSRFRRTALSGRRDEVANLADIVVAIVCQGRIDGLPRIPSSVECLMTIPPVPVAIACSLCRVWLVVTLLLAWALAPPAGAAESDRPPNVIFILADDLGYGDLGCFGQKWIETPHIDRLAAQGTRFTQAYAGATVCAPSRCSLMTGKHNGHAAIRGNQEVQPEGQFPMPTDTFTVAHLMKKAGYATGLIGKWGLGFPGSSSTPDKMGFDDFFGYNCQRKAHEYFPEYLWRNGDQVALGGKQYSHDLLAAEALEYVRRNKDRHFFLYLAFTIPHSKLQVPDIAPYADKDWPENLKTLAAMITRMDRDVGRLMALIAELSLDERTLVFFASDNGAAYRDELFAHSGPLRGYKRDLYEGGIRTPAIVRWPGKVKAGAVSEQVWSFADFLPTMAELTSQPMSEGLDGISILPALFGGEAIEHPPLYYEFHERGFQQAARLGDWKGVKLAPDRPVELYDLATDVGEKKDVAAQHPEVASKIERFLQTARVDSQQWTIPKAVARGLKQGKAKAKGAGNE